MDAVHSIEQRNNETAVLFIMPLIFRRIEVTFCALLTLSLSFRDRNVDRLNINLNRLNLSVLTAQIRRNLSELRECRFQVFDDLGGDDFWRREIGGIF